MIVAGVLTPLEDLLTWALEQLHVNVGLTWAWSIVALTIIVRAILLPLMVRQIHSMQNLQTHAPELKALQQRYKHDKAKQQEELMKFYKENKINPAASCLPIVAQLPVFLGLFFVLRDFEDEIFPAYQATGETLADLEWLNLVSIHDPTKVGWGPLLIVVYALSQLTSSYFMSTQMQMAQRVLLMVLPVAFIPFILNFPSGLMIYWLTTNLWTTGQGLVTRRLMPKPAPPPKRSSRTPPKNEPAPEPGDGKPKPKGGARPGGSQPRRVKKKKGGSRR